MIGSDSIVTVILDLEILETNTLWKEAPTVKVLSSWRKNSETNRVVGVDFGTIGLDGVGGGGRIVLLPPPEDAATSLSVIVTVTLAITIALKFESVLLDV